LDLQLNRVVISPHYGHKTDDGTPTGQNECQYKRTHARNEGKNGNQPSQVRGRQKTDQGYRQDMLVKMGTNQEKEDATHKEMMAQIEKKKKLNSVVLVRKRTIPTERLQPVGEVSANLS
jgi:hypothetical protein